MCDVFGKSTPSPFYAEDYKRVYKLANKSSKNNKWLKKKSPTRILLTPFHIHMGFLSHEILQTKWKEEKLTINILTDEFFSFLGINKCEKV